MNLLLLPGLLCDRAVWGPILPQLSAVAQCDIAEYSDARSLVAMAKRVLAGAPATFALAGHSMGARVALEIVRRAPDASIASPCSTRAFARFPLELQASRSGRAGASSSRWRRQRECA